MGDKHAVVALRSPQGKPDGVGANMLNGAAVHHRAAGIRFPPGCVGIEDDDVARTEIQHVVVLALRESQFHTPDLPFRLFVGRKQGKSVIDVTSLPFLFQRVMPRSGKARAFLGFVSQLRHHMLIGNEGEESEIIGFLQFRCLMYGVEHTG